MNNMNRYFTGICLLVFAICFNACIDQDFDSPPGLPVQGDDISTMTLSELKTLHTLGGDATAIPAGTIVKGIVVSDDATGNFFKDLVFQDETAGIHMRVNVSDLNTIYPRGREIFVSCEDLFLGEFGGLVQIGVASSDPANVDRLPEILAQEKIILGELKGVPVAAVKSIDQLSSSDISTLIELQGVEIEDGDLGETYAIAGGGSTRNRTVVDCDGNEITLRNSDFADFAGAEMPSGNGTITGVFSIFNSTLQFTIRDLEDVNMNEARCDGSGGMTGGGDIQEEDISNISIRDILDMHTPGANAVKLAAGTIFKGTVISDDQPGNFYKNLILQDETAGVQVRVDVIDLFLNYELGRTVYVNCDDLYVGDFNGLPQVGIQGEESGVNRISSNNAPNILLRGPVENLIQATPKTLNTISSDDLNTLVSFNSLQFADAELGATYSEEDFSTNRMLEDCDGNSIIIRNSSFADFAAEPIPEGNGIITAVLGVFVGDLQLFISDIPDVNFNGDRCDGSGGGPFIDERFESQDDFEDINLPGWTNVSTTGINLWTKNSFSGNGYAQATAFQATDDNVDAWLVTPELDLSQVSTMSFQSAKAFYVQDGLEVLYSSDFSGDVTTATWETVVCTLASESDEDFDWIDSGQIDLTSFGGATGFVAFRYQGDPAANTTTYRIDNLRVE